MHAIGQYLVLIVYIDQSPGVAVVPGPFWDQRRQYLCTNLLA
jgi:hypothetical protein